MELIKPIFYFLLSLFTAEEVHIGTKQLLSIFQTVETR